MHVTNTDMFFLYVFYYLVATASSSAFVDEVSEKFDCGSKILGWLCIKLL